MSKQTLQAFAEAVSNNKELQKQLAAIQRETAKATADKVAKLSESSDTPLTAEEYLRAVRDAEAQISEGQLQKVAGGTWEPSSANIMMSIAGLGLYCAIAAALSALGNGDADKCQAKYVVL